MQKEKYFGPNKQARSVTCPSIAFVMVAGKRNDMIRQYLAPIPPKIDQRIWTSTGQVIAAIAKRKIPKHLANRILYETRQYELAVSMYQYLTYQFPEPAPLPHVEPSTLLEFGGWRNPIVRRVKLSKESTGAAVANVSPATFQGYAGNKLAAAQRLSRPTRKLVPASGMIQSRVPAPSKKRKLDRVEYYAIHSMKPVVKL